MTGRKVGEVASATLSGRAASAFKGRWRGRSAHHRRSWPASNSCLLCTQIKRQKSRPQRGSLLSRRSLPGDAPAILSPIRRMSSRISRPARCPTSLRRERLQKSIPCPGDSVVPSVWRQKNRMERVPAGCWRRADLLCRRIAAVNTCVLPQLSFSVCRSRPPVRRLPACRR